MWVLTGERERFCCIHITGKSIRISRPRDIRRARAAGGPFRRRGLLLALLVVFVVLFGLPAFLIVVLDSLALVGDWLTGHVPFWDEVTDFYDWLWSYAE